MTITEKIVEDLVDKLDMPAIEEGIENLTVDLYWDRNACLSKDQVATILRADDVREALHQIEEEIEEANWEYRHGLQWDAALEYIQDNWRDAMQDALDELFPDRKEGEEPIEVDDDVLKIIIRNHIESLPAVDMNMKELLRLTGSVGVRITLHSNYDCMNSHHFMMSCSTDEEHYYALEDTYFGDAVYALGLEPAVTVEFLKSKEILPESYETTLSASGLIQPMVELDEVFYEEIVNSCSAANNLVILGLVDLREWVECDGNPSKVRIPKGNAVGFFDAIYGGGSMLDMRLIRDVEIELDKPMDSSGHLRWSLCPDIGSRSVKEVYYCSNDIYGDEISLVPQQQEEQEKLDNQHA